MHPFERALLYIGAPKTGTTSIQNVLRRNRAALLKQGVLVPHAGQGGTGQHIDLPAIVLSGESRADLDRHFDFRRLTREERRARFMADLNEEVADAPPCHTLLLFSEHMFYSDPAEVPAYRDLLSGHADRLECLMYLRRQDRWLASLSIQIRKTDPNWTLRLDAGPADGYGRRVRAWDEGADACHVRRFEPAFLRGGDLLADFCDVAGIDLGALEVGEARANPSLLREQLELMDALNVRIASLPPARRVHMRQGFVPLCTEAAGGTPIVFPRRDAEAAFAAFDEINGWLRRTRDPAGPDRFFDEDFDDAPENPDAGARYDEAALRAIRASVAEAAARADIRLKSGPAPANRAELIGRIVTDYLTLRRGSG